MAGELHDALMLYAERCLARVGAARTPGERALWRDELDGALALLDCIEPMVVDASGT